MGCLEAPAPVEETPVPEVEAPVPVCLEAPAPVEEAPAPVVEAPAPVVEAPAPAKSFGLPIEEMTEDWMDDDVGCLADSEDDSDDLPVSTTVVKAAGDTNENITAKEIIESKCDKNDNYLISEEITSSTSSSEHIESLDFCVVQKKTVTVTEDSSEVTELIEEKSVENGLNGTHEEQ